MKKLLITAAAIIVVAGSVTVILSPYEGGSLPPSTS